MHPEQTVPDDSEAHMDTPELSVLSIELASCHPSGA
jgi:hypothetical protein